MELKLIKRLVSSKRVYVIVLYITDIVIESLESGAFLNVLH